MEIDIKNLDKMVQLSKEMSEHPEKFIGKKYIRKGKVIVTENVQGIITAINLKASGRVDVILDDNTDEPIIFDTNRETWASQEYIDEQKCSLD